MSAKATPTNIHPLELYTKNQLCSISSNMWSRPATALLIEMYRKLECLWKTNSLYYRNKKKRHDALQEIATAITPFRPDTTVEDVKNKINGIRTQYVAEKNKVSFYAKKNPPMEYEPSLWCYDRLSFLAAYTSLKNKSTSDGNTINLISNTDDMVCPEKQFQVKIEDCDETELIESQDFSTCEDNEGCSPSQQSVHYINIEPHRKKAKISRDDDSETDPSNAVEKIFTSPRRPEITLIKSSKHKTRPSSSGDHEEESANFCQKSEESSVIYTENDDWIEVFGKFVTTQMKLITNKTLLIQLQHTIQSAIMNTQLKQIEIDRQ